MRRVAPLLLVTFAAVIVGCGSGKKSPTTTPRAAAPTPQQLDSLWTEIESLMARKKWTNAIIKIERFSLQLPFGDRRAIPAIYQLGEAYFGEKSNLLAVREFRQVADQYPTDSLAPIALLRAGDAYADLWRRPELDPTDAYSAQAVYEEVISRYPATPAAEKAKAAIVLLENKFALKDLKTAEFYLKYKAFDSAITYLRNVIVHWPRATVMPQVLTHLIETYRLLDYKEDVTETCAYFRAQWPTAPQLATTCKQPGSTGKP